MRHDGDGLWVGTTRQRSGLGPVTPGEKAVPIMTEWGAFLFAARNRDDNVGEVWKYNNASRRYAFSCVIFVWFFLCFGLRFNWCT